MEKSLAATILFREDLKVLLFPLVFCFPEHLFTLNLSISVKFIVYLAKKKKML